MVLSRSIIEPHLSTKMINSLEKTAIVAENHGVVPHNGAMCPTSTQLLWLLYT